MRNGLAVAAVVALTLTAAGCSGSGGEQGNGAEANAAGAQPQDAQASANGTDPCSLVTAEEVGAILGEPITAKAASDGACRYETADAGASSVTIELDQSDAAEAMSIARTAAGALKDMGGAAAEQGGAGADVNAMLSEGGDTPKIGDEAFFGPNAQLSVRKGNSYIAVQPPIMRSRMSSGNPMLSSDDRKKMALAVAEKALTRLP
jgi:hypothetical protein